MKFFIPKADVSSDPEKIIIAIADFIQTDIPERKIYSIEYNHNSYSMRAEVGKSVDKYYQESVPLVIAILRRGNIYCICTPNRGVTGGEPILVGESYVTKIEYFD